MMGKRLVLAEKPSVARDLARVLGCGKDRGGYMEGKEDIVTWALGHLVTLADPESYSDSYKTWRMEDLPMLPPVMKLVTIKQTMKQFRTVKTLLHRDDVTEVVIATDAGREGELVARWILEKAGSKKPLKRLWISSVTDKAIREGFAHLIDGSRYDTLYMAAAARAEADWLVGINATRALTCKHNAQLSCGRVQTPTLAMIAARQEEIERFSPKLYYGLQYRCRIYRLTWYDAKTKETRIFSRQRCEDIKKKIEGKRIVIREVMRKKKQKNPPQLYDLTELQRDANKLYGFSAKETLSLMQRLYESHKLLTYPRTDSRYLSADIVPTLGERLKSCGVGAFRKTVFQILQKPIVANKNFVDDAKVSDHHAIIPTEQFVNIDKLTERERKIYELVVRRFLAVLLPAMQYEEVTVVAECEQELFRARGTHMTSLGWRSLYEQTVEEEDDDDCMEQSLPAMAVGDMPEGTVCITEGKTKPPAYFTEATLLSAMEHPAKYMAEESAELKKLIGVTGGIGTVATRADIIEKLFKTFLIEKKDRSIHVTGKGKQLLALAPEELRSPALTARWEQTFEEIIRIGKTQQIKFLEEIRDYTKKIIASICKSETVFRHDNVTRSKCPECGKFLLAVNGKTSKMLVCPDRECGFRKTLAQTTNARCPECHKKMELRGQGDSKTFWCACGYKEKVSSRAKRKSQSAAKVSKREVHSYLKQQDNTSLGSDAMKLAFASLMADKGES